MFPRGSFQGSQKTRPVVPVLYAGSVVGDPAIAESADLWERKSLERPPPFLNAGPCPGGDDESGQLTLCARWAFGSRGSGLPPPKLGAGTSGADGLTSACYCSGNEVPGL